MRSEQAHTLDHTYASCIDQNTAQLFYVTAALNNHVLVEADASKAFAEAEGPKQEYYIHLDDDFNKWWKTVLREHQFQKFLLFQCLEICKGIPKHRGYGQNIYIEFWLNIWNSNQPHKNHVYTQEYTKIEKNTFLVKLMTLIYWHQAWQ